MCSRRAGCSGTGTSGSEGGGEETTSRKAETGASPPTLLHIPLNRYVVIELKLGKFRPQYAGQINFYVNVVDDQLRSEHHDSTIGLVLCASRNQTVARYALQGINRPVGVARYTAAPPTLVEKVPEELHDQLPELDQISAGVQRIVERHAEEIAQAEADLP
jgi:YhcG PDDEXK nuclease domain